MSGPRRGVSAGRRAMRCGVVLASLAVAASLAGCAAGPSATLPVPLHPQEQTRWCWAACGQMVMEFHGVAVGQCTQANDQLGRTDCRCDQCTAPLVDPPCNAGGFPLLERYGFEYNRTTGRPVSWRVLKRELTQGGGSGRPVIFTHAYEGGGGHQMVAVGCEVRQFRKHVLILDPLSAGATCVGEAKLVTHAWYREGPDGIHWDDLYEIRLAPPAGP